MTTYLKDRIARYKRMQHRCKTYQGCRSCGRPMRVHPLGLNAWCIGCWDRFYATEQNVDASHPA